MSRAYAQISSFAIFGIDAYRVTVETCRIPGVKNPGKHGRWAFNEVVEQFAAEKV